MSKELKDSPVSPSSQNMIFEAFDQSIKLPKSTRDIVESYCQLCTAFESAIFGAVAVASQICITSNAIPAEQLHDRVHHVFSPRMDRQYTKILSAAISRNLLDKFTEPLDLAREALDLLSKALLTPVLLINGHLRAGRANPVGIAQRQLESSLTMLRRLKPLLFPNYPSGTERPMAETLEDIWKLLDGQVLKAKEIAVQLGRDEDSIRHSVSRIRKKGKVIDVHAEGYFRPDRPPQIWAARVITPS